jgi:hypothetical protein
MVINVGFEVFTAVVMTTRRHIPEDDTLHGNKLWWPINSGEFLH